MNERERCSYCGKYGVYAKGLCRTCYNRQRNNGGMIPSREEELRKRWMGLKFGTWEIIGVLPNQKALLKCTECGRTKIMQRNSLLRQGGTRPCVCSIEHLVPRTEAQARIYKAVLHNKGSVSKAAKDLGISRQGVHSVLETMRKNMREEI